MIPLLIVTIFVNLRAVSDGNQTQTRPFSENSISLYPGKLRIYNSLVLTRYERLPFSKCMFLLV